MSTPAYLLVLVVSVFASARVYRLFRVDRIGLPVREQVDTALWEISQGRWAEKRRRKAVADWLGYLAMCPWCLNVYFATFFVGTGLLWSEQFWYRLLTGLLAVSYLAALLNAHLDKPEDS